MTHSLVSVDPGKKDAGVALFLDGKLVSAAYLAPVPGNPFEVARMVEAWLFSESQKRAGITTSTGKVSVLVIEGQQVYPGRSKADPNDLLPLAETVGGVKARISAFTVLHPLPRDWTGSVPKEVRHRRLLGRVDDATLELIRNIKAPKGELHDVLDAIALGFWALGRLPPEPENGYRQ